MISRPCGSAGDCFCLGLSLRGWRAAAARRLSQSGATTAGSPAHRISGPAPSLPAAPSLPLFPASATLLAPPPRASRAAPTPRLASPCRSAPAGAPLRIRVHPPTHAAFFSLSPSLSCPSRHAERACGATVLELPRSVGRVRARQLLPGTRSFSGRLRLAPDAPQGRDAPWLRPFSSSPSPRVLGGERALPSRPRAF